MTIEKTHSGYIARYAEENQGQKYMKILFSLNFLCIVQSVKKKSKLMLYN